MSCWLDGGVRPIVPRSDARPDLVLTLGEGVSVTVSGHGVVMELPPYELPLFLWGRCPPRLRDPNANAETVEDVLKRAVRDNESRWVGGE
jgi:hypothetical protein